MVFETFTVRSNLGIEEAFARLVDLTQVDAWDRGVRDPTLVRGDGPALGSRYQVTVTGFDGEPTTVIYELTEFEEPDRFVMIGENAAFRAHDTVTLTSLEPDAGCDVTYVAGLELLGEDPPLSDAELESLFAKIVAVPHRGLAAFLNP